LKMFEENVLALKPESSLAAQLAAQLAAAPQLAAALLAAS